MAASKVKSLEQFRAAHDKNFIIPAKIQAGITKLGAKGWEYWGEFLRINTISVSDGRSYAAKFEGFMLTVEKKSIICGSTALAKQMRNMV